MYNEIDHIIDNLMSYFQVSTISQLSEAMGISQQTVSAWKSRNSITAIKKRCRELQIFDEIFHDFNIQSIQTVSGGQVAHSIHGNQNSNNHEYELCKQIDKVSLTLMLDMYLKAKESNRIKEFKMYLLNFE